MVVDEPDVRESNTKLTIKVDTIFKDSSTSVSEKVYPEKILVTVPLYPEYSYGDKVRMSLTLEEPKNILSDDGRVFDYKGYLRVRGIWYTSRFAKVEVLSSSNGNTIKAFNCFFDFQTVCIAVYFESITIQFA